MQLLKLVSIVAVLVMAGCATWYEETYKNPDRQCWKSTEEFGSPIQCQAFIELECPSYNFSQVPNQGDKKKKSVAIFVESEAGPSSPLVGNLTAQISPFPIYTKSSPWQILLKDLSNILLQHGYLLVEKADEADYRLMTTVTYLDVRSKMSWTKGVTHASAKFTVTVSDSINNEIDRKVFSGEHSAEFTYAYLKDYEAILGIAYCQALKQFYTTLDQVNTEKQSIW